MTALIGYRNVLANSIREFFAKSDYLEIETPILVNTPGTEVHLDYFETTWVDSARRSHRLFLRSSPEIALKKQLSKQRPKIFELARCFRNHGEHSDWHRPEFTMLEWYEVNASFDGFMAQTEELINYCYDGLSNSVNDRDLLKPPKTFEKISVYEAFRDFANLKLLDNDYDLAQKAKESGCQSIKLHDDFETAFFKVLFDKVEPALANLGFCFLYDYPPSMAALAKIQNGRAKRFELYINGVEVCNAFFEEMNAHENYLRLLQANINRLGIGKPDIPVDSNFLDSLKSEKKSACGNALGFERLLALLLRCKTIADVSAGV